LVFDRLRSDLTPASVREVPRQARDDRFYSRSYGRSAPPETLNLNIFHNYHKKHLIICKYKISGEPTNFTIPFVAMKKATHFSLVLLLGVSLVSWSHFAFAAPDYSTSLPVVEVSASKSKTKGKGLLARIFGKRSSNSDRTVAAAGACTRLSDLVKPTRSRSRRARDRNRNTEAPANFKVYTSSRVLAKATPKNSHLHIDISEQRAYLIINGEVGMETPVSTASPNKHTPRGTFRVTERVREGKISTLYGVLMPYWQRLDGTVFGIHAGYLPGRPASAGCVRLPREGARIAFDHMASGVPVSIHEKWSPETDFVAR
jgi:lipoprotein-anchoring transpeptidase ErfK/SrfK